MSGKIAVCSTGASSSSPVDERFGRCAYFMIWDPQTGDFTALENTVTDSAHGAGTGAVQALLQNQVELILSQRIGPKAFAVIEQAGIKVFSGISGKTVAEALQSHENGELQQLLTPNN